MRPPNFFARATRIFQNTAQPSQSDRHHQHLSPTDSAHQSDYETDGSSYEMLVVESPSRPRRVTRHQSQQNQKLRQQDRSEPQNAKQDQPQQQQIKLQKASNQHEPEQRSEPQPERRTPSPTRSPAQPQTPPRKRSGASAEPQTPSQRLPVALRRIDATPTPNVPEKRGYNLRSRTRSVAPPTPQRRPTPARSRRRELRQAPSARTTSGIAGRPSIVSRREIDESSYVTLRALCRSFGLATSGTKTELRARALGKFEDRRILDEQTQPLENESKLREDLRDAGIGVQPPNDIEQAKRENEENSGPVQMGVQTRAVQEERQGAACKQEPGRQITTSTVKPAGRGKRLLVEANIPSKSDEPSVHAKSDAPENDPRRQAVHAAQCSTANSPVPAVAQEARKTARPTVSSTGVAANSADSPRPAPPHPTPRLAEPPFPFPSQRRPDGPTESVDARGGVDVAAIFQELASGHRKLSAVEYDAALRALKETAPDRPRPMQISINAARVSLSTLPTTPQVNFKPPSARASAGVSGVIPTQNKSPVLTNNLAVKSSRAALNSSVPPQASARNGDAAEKSDDNRTSAPKETKILSPPEAPQLLENENEEATQQAKCVSLGQEPACDGDGDNVISNHRKERGALEQQPLADTKRRILETPPKSKPSPNGNRTELASGAQLEPKLAELNQIPLPPFFEGARGGPHEGNIINLSSVRTPVPNARAAQVATDGDGELEPERDEACKDEQGGREVTRSGFATPRELVRRFNRSRNDYLNYDEDIPLRPSDVGDPAISLLRRNARRSSSGVPLFYSARGPSTAGRSILKARRSSKAREAQDHLRRIDRSHNLSGRASFRVKRPLSASAGALLVDLRRTSVAGGPAVERMHQRGSFQAELARRPPPMAASALRILNDLQKIQEENRAHVSLKRNVDPPPLPPSVVKRARRSGQFSLSESRPDERLPAKPHNQTDALGKDSSVSIFALDRISDPKGPGSDIPFGRQTPKVPLVAYGAGNRRSKRSRTSRLTSVALSTIEDDVEEEIEKKGIIGKAEVTGNDANIARTKRRREREALPGIEDKVQQRASLGESTIMPQRATKPVMSSTFNTQDRAEGQLLPSAEVGRRDTSAVPVDFANSANSSPFRFPQRQGGEERGGSANVENSIFKTGAERPSIAEKSDTEGERVRVQDSEDTKLLRTPPHTERKTSEFKRPSSFLQPTIDRQNVVENHAARTTDTNFSTVTAEKTSKALQGHRSEAESYPSKDKRVVAGEVISTDEKQDTAGSRREYDKSEHLPTPLQPQDNRFSFPTSQHSEDNGVQAPTGSSEPSFLDSKIPSGSNLGFPASPFARPVKSFSLEGQKEYPEKVKVAQTKQSAGISIPSNALPTVGSLRGREGSAGMASAPSIPTDEGGLGAQFTFGGSPFIKPIQTKAGSLVQDKEASSSLLEKGNMAENETASGLSTLQPIPAVSVVSRGSKETDVPASKATSDRSTKMKPGKPLESRSNVFPNLHVKPTFGIQHGEKAEGLPSSKASAPLSNNDEPAVATKSLDPTNSTVVTAAITPLPSTVGVKFREKASVCNPLKNDELVPASDKHADPFTSNPFATPVEQKESKLAFSFSAAPKDGDSELGGPFADAKFKSPFSSSNPSNMFVFGSSTGGSAEVKPAPSISALGKSATPDAAQSNPFAPPTSTAPFGAKSAGQPDGMTQNSGPTFGMSSSAGLNATFGLPATNAVSGFGSSFGSSPALFNADASNSFAAGSTVQPFGGSSDSNAPMFGSVNMPATPFGTASGPAAAQTFGTPSSGSAASNMFGASSGGASAPVFGGAATPGSFTFGTSNASTFGSQQNLFNQNGNLSSMSSAGTFGTAPAGAFNMGSATRPPQTQRRRLRGRRTLR